MSNKKEKPKKRGRKRKTKQYFGPEQEQAVVDFLESDSQEERTKIYNKWLKEPLNKMIESIIRRYDLYSNTEDFRTWRDNALSFLIYKSGKFKPEKGKKAYSYYGTICRNYLTGLLIKETKHKNRNYSYEDMFTTIEKRDDMKYDLKTSDYSMENFITDISGKIKEEMEEAEENDDIKDLTENEKKVGFALIDILDNWEEYVELSNNKKYNKIQFLADVREYTHLNTKEIRKAIKRYKVLYNLFKQDRINEGYL